MIINDTPLYFHPVLYSVKFGWDLGKISNKTGSSELYKLMRFRCYCIYNYIQWNFNL